VDLPTERSHRTLINVAPVCDSSVSRTAVDAIEYRVPGIPWQAVGIGVGIVLCGLVGAFTGAVADAPDLGSIVAAAGPLNRRVMSSRMRYGSRTAASTTNVRVVLEIEPCGPSVLPVNSLHDTGELAQSLTQHIQWVGIDELCGYVFNRRIRIVDLQVHVSKLGVGLVLMPANEQRPFRFDPVNPVSVWAQVSDPAESDLNSSFLGRIVGDIEKQTWIRLSNDTVLSRGSDARS
jgi:hypothetical protein